jgi:DNA-directed RNA polymerase subunit RPC12/RpoP
VINYNCGKCGAQMQSPESLAGTREQCWQCSTVNIVPEEVVVGVMNPLPNSSNVNLTFHPPQTPVHAKCVRCAATATVRTRSGYDWVRGLLWCLLLGPLGLLLGFWGAADMVNQCTRCGKKWPIYKTHNSTATVVLLVLILCIIAFVVLIIVQYV